MTGYKEFYSEKDVNEWLKLHYGNFINNIQSQIDKNTNKFADLLYSYGGSAYKEYNSILREIDGKKELLNNKDKYNRELIEEIEILEDGISKVQVSDNIVIYRYTKKKYIKALLKKSKNDNKVIADRGFLSTTLLPDTEGMRKLVKEHRYNCILKIYIPKGTSGVPIKFNNKQTILNEHEFLFLPNTRLKIIGGKFNLKIFKTIYECNMV